MNSTTPISVIVPVYNDAEGIQTTLNALVSQTTNNYEVLPVDNNSTDKTGDVIAEFVTDYPDVIRPFEETDIQSSYAARNTGVKYAEGDVILFLDADMWVPDTWIEEMMAALETRDCDYLGCNVKLVANDEPTFSERYEQALSFPVKTYLEDKHFAPTCALAVRCDIFDKVGLFDEQLESGGDKEFGQRVYQARFEQCYTSDVTAYHPARDSWDKLKSKALRIGRGRAQIRRYHPEIGTYLHPLHPINYLPPSPFRLKRRFSGYDTSLSELICFYFLEYLLKLTQTYGTIHESLAIHRSEREKN
ncbi:glycosyltransferase [Halobellus rarus]|uniref:Glycosyltransferase n=1 Tax=Halobellus rarus TaxID=1126237 RepID=A0ABD6CNG4_9EURY|nr:glycosyltransferase [Halobellus rarus]